MFAVAAFLCLAGLVNSGRSDNGVLGSRPQYILFSVQRYALHFYTPCRFNSVTTKLNTYMCFLLNQPLQRRCSRAELDSNPFGSKGSDHGKQHCGIPNSGCGRGGLCAPRRSHLI